MRSYHVSWSMTVEAENPREAVDIIVAKMGGETISGWTPHDDVFEVADAATGEKTTIDLEEDREPCAS
jgi:hypothetical protein